MIFVRRLFILIILMFFFNFDIIPVSKIQAPKYIKDQGAKVFERGNYNESIKYYLRILNSYPDDEQILLYLAYSYKNIGQFHKSEKSYIDILTINPKNYYSINGLTVLYQNRIQEALSKNNYNLAFDYVKKAEYYIPEMSFFYSKDAELNMQIGNYREAANLWKTSWEKDPLDIEKKIQSESWKLEKMGECYRYLDKESSKDWKKYIFSIQKKFPKNKELMLLVADMFFYYGEEPTKRNDLRNKALKLYESEHVGRKTVSLNFPLKGKWIVTSGNFEYQLDTHNGYDGYCYDLMKLDSSGNRLVSGNGSKNSDFLSYNEDIYAVWDGVVESTCDGIGDNAVGKASNFSTNQIKIRHFINGETYFTTYLHLKNGSIQVSVGESVKAGQLIGKVGNSGYSFAPHLHFGCYDTNRVSVPIKFIIGNEDEETEIKIISNLKKSTIIIN